MISIVCPSRGRPDLAKRMIDSAIATAGQEIEILLYLNDDDPTLDQYKKLIDSKYIIIGPDRSPVYSWNKLVELARYDIYFLIGDDVQFGSNNWAKMVLDAFDNYPDKIACVYPVIPGVKTSNCLHFCLHKNWVDTVGYFLPPHFWHWYVDWWIKVVAKKLGRMHPILEFTMPIIHEVQDETTARKDRLCLRERDHYLWEKTNRHLYADVDILKKFISEFK